MALALALATFTPDKFDSAICTPGKFDPDAKPNPRAILSMVDQRPKPRRARLLGSSNGARTHGRVPCTGPWLAIVSFGVAQRQFL